VETSELALVNHGQASPEKRPEYRQINALHGPLQTHSLAKGFHKL